ncbi:MAG: hypothetical protein ABSH08_16600 [Tepidisphaeraceae bacterium]|jgi:hypothetical protein
MNPSGVKMNPDPLPPGWFAADRPWWTSIFTTAGLAIRAAFTTVRE